MDNVSAGKPMSKAQQISYSIATLGSSSLGAVISAFAFFFYVRVVFQVETGDAQAEFIKNTLIGAALAIGWWVEAIAKRKHGNKGKEHYFPFFFLKNGE